MKNFLFPAKIESGIQAEKLRKMRKSNTFTLPACYRPRVGRAHNKIMCLTKINSREQHPSKYMYVHINLKTPEQESQTHNGAEALPPMHISKETLYLKGRFTSERTFHPLKARFQRTFTLPFPLIPPLGGRFTLQNYIISFSYFNYFF